MNINIILIIILCIIFFNQNKIINIVEKYTANNVEKYTANIVEKYTAIIVEPRKHKALELVLTNFLENLDDRWNFIIFHGLENEIYIKNIIQNKPQNNRIKLVNLNVKNLTIADYNKLFYSKFLYDNIPTEVFLVFQTDTLICKKYKDLIYKFIKYDYVGAPWLPTSWNTPNCSKNNVGNGGLSLRKKSKMLELLNNCTHNNINEDQFFSKVICNCKYDVKLYKPSEIEAKEFAIEHIYNNKSFGVHKPWLYITENINFCDDLDKLIILNKK